MNVAHALTDYQHQPIYASWINYEYILSGFSSTCCLTSCLQEVLRTGTSIESPSSRTSLLILDYVLRLAAVDLSYDIRDRARLYNGLLAFHLQKVSREGTGGSEKDVGDQLLSLHDEEPNTDQDVGEGKAGARHKEVLLKFAERAILATKPVPTLPPLAPERSKFVAGSMSHIVLHRAPNYFPLPDPSSVELVEPPSPSRDRQFARGDADPDSSSDGEFSGNVSDGRKSDRTSSPKSSGSFYDEDPGEIPASSSEDERSGRNKSETFASSSHGKRWQIKQGKRPQELGPLIDLYDSDGGAQSGTQKYEVDQLNDAGLSSEFGLLSTAGLESWLGTPEPSREEQPASSLLPSGYATVSLGRIDVKARLSTLLDFTNGGGLDVKYSFDRANPSPMDSTLSIKLYFSNQSAEIISDIAVTDTESGDDYHAIRYVAGAIGLTWSLAQLPIHCVVGVIIVYGDPV